MSFMDAFQKDQSAKKTKPVLGVAIGIGKGKPTMGEDDPMPDKGEGEDDGGLNPGEAAAAKAAMASLKGGDLSGFGLALKQFVRACSSYDDDDDDDDDEGDASDAGAGMSGSMMPSR